MIESQTDGGVPPSSVRIASPIRGGVARRRFMGRSSRALLRNPAAMVGLALIVLVGLAAVTAPWIAPYDPVGQTLSDRTLPPSQAHLFGTDQYGRDLLSRVLWGGRSSLMIGALSALLGTLVGTALGLVSGYVGRTVEVIIMRLTDWLLAFPLFLLALMVVATLGPGQSNVIVAIAVSTVPRIARLVRSQTLQIKKLEYIEAARAVGCSGPRIVIRHILPNALSVVIVLFTLYLATAILAEATLSFLGLGTVPPAPSWGLMVSSARGLLLTAPWTVIAPGAAITVTILGLNLFGDALRDALDPRLS